ncbi:hypothetical protein OROMI_006617 [Orobanche minor]
MPLRPPTPPLRPSPTTTTTTPGTTTDHHHHSVQYHRPPPPLRLPPNTTTTTPTATHHHHATMITTTITSATTIDHHRHSGNHRTTTTTTPSTTTDHHHHYSKHNHPPPPPLRPISPTTTTTTATPIITTITPVKTTTTPVNTTTSPAAIDRHHRRSGHHDHNSVDVEDTLDGGSGRIEASAVGDFASCEAERNLEPCEGMVFYSEASARAYYDEYAGRMGFLPRVLSSRKSERDGSIISCGIGCRSSVHIQKSVDEKDKRIQELTAELRIKKRLSAAYREQLLILMKDVENHNNHLISKVQIIRDNLKELEARKQELPDHKNTELIG